MAWDAQKLRRARERKALSLRELASLAGVSYSAIWQIETGQRPPRPSTIRKLATALGIEPSELIGDDSRPERRDQG